MINKITSILILVFLLLNLQSYSQKITGKVIDDQDLPVSFATVALVNAQSNKLEKAGTTDLNGEFEIEGIKPTKYLLKISFVGLKNYQSDTINYIGNNINLNSITLSKALNNLQTVEVSTIRPLIEVEPDKTVFNVEGTVNAAGSDALELLRKAPGVTLDNSNNISLKGTSGVIVYIDGKPSILSQDDLATYLETLDASQIDKFEIISNPSAKYDAQGQAGIINIILKKQKTISSSATINLGYNQGNYFPKYKAAITGNYKKNKLNSFINYSFNNRKHRSFSSFYREQNNNVFERNDIHKRAGISHNLKFGSDYALNNKHSIGIALDGSMVNNASSESRSNTFLGPETIGYTQNLSAGSNETRSRQNGNINLNYRYNDTTGHSLSIDVDYGNFTRSNYSDIFNVYSDIASSSNVLNTINYVNDNASEITLKTMKTDYEQNLFSGKIGFGLKLSDVTTQNNLNFYDKINEQLIINENRTNYFTYTERVSAAYISWTGKLTKKLKMQSGLRAEQTISQGILQDLRNTGGEESNVKRNYLNLFPNIGFTYSVNKNNNFSLSASRRINRPSYRNLNPFEIIEDELKSYKGNPFLLPELTSIIELNHSFKGALNTSVRYSYTDMFFGEVLLPSTNSNSSFTTVANLQSKENLGVSTSLSLPVKKWWFSYLTLYANYLENKGDLGNGNIVDLNVLNGGLYGQNTFTLKHNIKMEISGWYSSTSIWQGNMKSAPMGGIDIGFQKKILKDKGNLRIMFSDVFKMTVWEVESITSGMYQKGNGGWESQQVRLNFTYTFGNSNIKANNRKSGNSDETKRIGGE